MAMKQTQVKTLSFGDVGLDFCVGSRNLFPDRFKKMLSLGYNVQTVSSVIVSGNQVTFTYGGAHGYVADRVLKVSAPELLSINGGEFVIDSVTENTVTVTIDGTPTSIAGNFTTKVASLGYDLVYEQANIHIYKFKALDETDLYLRLVFTTAANARNVVMPCIGKSVDLINGVITDPDAYQPNKDITQPAINALQWEFYYGTTASTNNYTYSEGFLSFGTAIVVGSQYHLAFLYNDAYHQYAGQWVCGFIPTSTLDYEKLKQPVLFGSLSAVSLTSSSYINAISRLAWFLGNIQTTLQARVSSNQGVGLPIANEAFLSQSIDTFNTTVVMPITIFEKETSQFLGFTCGMYLGCYGGSNSPSLNHREQPIKTIDIDLNNQVIIGNVGNLNTGHTNSLFLVFPVEEVKIA